MLLLASTSLSAQVLERDQLQRKQEDQQRARNMTRELVQSILDIQLRQLEENGLQDIQVYRDIRMMRSSINNLVDAEMAKVVEVLVTAQEKPPEERETDFVEARQMIRTIVLRLSAERQNLLRRLKTAELSEQVRRLATMQQTVQAATKSLPMEARARQEALALKATEDQRDVKSLFLHLVETLADVQTWGGPLSNGAADGLRILKAADVGRHLDDAGTKLAATRYVDATGDQEQVIRGLMQLLKVIERTQGIVGTEPQATLDKIRELAARQEEIREETRKLDANVPPSAELVEQQGKLQKDLDQLVEPLRENPSAETHLERAKAAAFEATAHLFDAKTDDAVHEQGQVLGHLAALEELLNDAAEQTQDRSAAQLAEQVRQLESAKQDVQAAQAKQRTVAETARNTPREAVEPEEDVASDLIAVAEKHELPASIDARLVEAEEAARAAARELSQGGEQPEAADEKSLATAQEALERALAEIDAAIADTRRKEAAVRIGELARAAEVLERAAAEERQIAERAGQAAEADEHSAEQTRELAARQAEVQAIAEKVAEGLTTTAPKTAPEVAQAAKLAKQARQTLSQAGESPTEEAKKSEAEASATARQAAEQLASAARNLRDEIAHAAGELAKLSGEQVKRLSEAREKVDQAIHEQPASVAERLDRLRQAREAVAQGMIEQHRASGRPEVAAALELAGGIEAALRTQQESEQAEPMSMMGDMMGEMGPSLEAVAKQQEVADQTQSLAERAAKLSRHGQPPEFMTDELLQTLQTAQQAAGEAAKRALDGQPDAAATARTQVRQALRKAQELVEARTRSATADVPHNPSDAAAQARVTEAARKAQELAADDADAAAESLEQAGEMSDEARQELVAGEPAVELQQQTAESLRQADQQLSEAIRALTTQQATELAAQARKTQSLAQKTAPVEPGATNALRAAQRAAQQVGAPQTATPSQVASAEEGLERNLERATANLAAKEQQVRRDQAVAEALAELAHTQQEAAADIAKTARQLGELAKTEPAESADESNPLAMSPQRQLAAAALAQATQRFAEAQQATGQGAVEISGQEQVANLPLREALDLASNLPLTEWQNLLPALRPQAANQEAEQTAESASSQSPPTNQTRQASGQPQQSPANLGTGFVPNSPGVTARMMAGPQALAQAQAALSALSQQPAAQEQAQDGQPKESDPKGESSEANSQTASTKPSDKAKGRQQPNGPNQPVQDGPLARDDSQRQPQTPQNNGQTRDADSESRILREEPWFAKLPPELRQTIRANAQRRAPRSYEERLRRYFESLD